MVSDEWRREFMKRDTWECAVLIEAGMTMRSVSITQYSVVVQMQ